VFECNTSFISSTIFSSYQPGISYLCIATKLRRSLVNLWKHFFFVCELWFVGDLYELKIHTSMETACDLVFVVFSWNLAVLYENLSSAGELRGDRPSDSPTLLTGVNEFLSVYSVFLDRSVWTFTFRALWFIKTLVTSTNAQLYSLYILSINHLPRVSALSPSSGNLHQNFITTYSST
jgi:hypothetical protein